MNQSLPRIVVGAALVALAGATAWSEPAGEAEPPTEAQPAGQAIAASLRPFLDRGEIAGAVTLAATREGVFSLEAIGSADLAAGRPMQTDSIFWIASMTKPITATAVLMLQDEGKLSVEDPVAKYLPELADLKTPDGKPAGLTLRHLLTHTSGMAEATAQQSRRARTLGDLVPYYAEKPVAFDPGSRWQYCQSGINSLGRIVEVVSGQSFPEFLRERLFGPLGMKDTAFYLSPEQQARLAKSYRLAGGKLQETGTMGYDPTRTDHYPAANGGLFSTASDYARFCRMILNEGSLDGKQYLKAESVKLMTTLQTAELATGFTEGNGWGLGWCVVRRPQGVTAALSPGSFGHGGAYGTQAWIDPVRGAIYILMVQRADFPNADNSDPRRAFQAAASAALPPPAKPGQGERKP